METTKNAIYMENVSKKYNNFSLDNINLTLPTGTVMGFIGKNGAGKTTTIKSLLNIISPDYGKIEILGHDVKDIKMHEDIGVVFDELSIPDTLNCKMIDSIMKNIFKNWDSSTFNKYLDSFALPSKLILKKFSRGMQMKVQLAVALSHNASLLLLDEATAGLDPIARNEFLDILMDFMEDETHSILMSSHITSDLERIADYITFIDNGKIILSDEKYTISESHVLVKGSIEELNELPSSLIISSRKNSYGCEALIKCVPELAHTYTDLVFDTASLDDILYFYVKKEHEK